ncbi:hypothetical protein D3C86_1937340 [compost metagenome]
MRDLETLSLTSFSASSMSISRLNSIEITLTCSRDSDDMVRMPLDSAMDSSIGLVSLDAITSGLAPG